MDFNTFVINILLPFLSNSAYVFAKALQLAAGILLIENSNTTRPGIIKAFCERHTAIAFEQTGVLADPAPLQNIVKSTWINKIAFYYLFGGYVIDIFGQATIHKVWLIICVSILTAVLSYIVFKVAKYQGNHFAPIRIKDVPNINSVMYVILEAQPTPHRNETNPVDAKNISEEPRNDQ